MCDACFDACLGASHIRAGCISVPQCLFFALQLAAELRAAGRRPYVIPVGGSNALGSWGYLEAVQELIAQLPPEPAPTDAPAAEAAAGEGGGGAASDAAPSVPPRAAHSGRPPSAVPSAFDHVVFACGSGGTAGGLGLGLELSGLRAAGTAAWAVSLATWSGLPLLRRGRGSFERPFCCGMGG